MVTHAREVVALLALVVVLAVAVVRPRGLPEAAGAVPAAVLLLLVGALTPAAALDEVARLGPTVGFLAAILVLSHLADAAGVFRWLAGVLVRGSRGEPTRLLALVVVASAVTTAVLSLDATVVLLVPAVVASARALRTRPRPHVHAAGHLANSASTLLPVSNLTNLLAFTASGVSFLGFAALMALPWLTAVAVEHAVLRWWFRRDLVVEPDPAGQDPGAAPGPAAAPVDDLPAPRLALAVLALTLAGFAVSGFVGLEPVWVALAGAVVLAVTELRARTTTPVRVVLASSPLFCLFVLALGVVVAAVTTGPLGTLVGRVLPRTADLAGLAVAAVVAAVLANVVNNLPATLLLLGVLGAGAPTGLVLAVLLGVNLGPNLTYVGSLATLLWRQVLTERGDPPSVAVFTRLGLVTVPATLVVSVLTLWLGLRVLG
ncbi:ArsB/NhaD family transporter [Rhodococcus aerolatus]